MNAATKTHPASTKTECDYLNGWIKIRSHTQKISPKQVNPRGIAGESRRRRRMVKPGDIAGERTSRRMVNSRDIAGTQKKKNGEPQRYSLAMQKKNGEPLRYSWGTQRRKKKKRKKNGEPQR